MNSPFKFLDAYELEDREVFFGRDDEVEKLYTELKKSRLVLVYGESGAGKTSLIQCGLASQYEYTDWLPIFVRRNEDLNKAFDKALADELKGDLLDSYPESIQRLFALSLRPVYLIFDQFEELLIMGDENEKKQFAQNISIILDAQLPCRILFVLREEYLPQLYEFERIIPSLMDSRLRVEPMSNAKVASVMESSFEKFNIHLENDNQALIELMIDNLSGSRTGIQLPYLQVYLDMLYREGYRRLDPVPAEDLPTLEITEQGINDFGQIEDVLQKFLDEQKTSLERDLNNKFIGLQENAVGRLLDLFVTDDGTKKPVNYGQVQDRLEIDDKVLARLPDFDADCLEFALEELGDRRILRFQEDTIELAHDSLADLIEQARTDEQREMNAVIKRVDAAYKEYLATSSEYFLNEKQLASIEPYLDLINLDENQAQFITRSQEYNEALRNRQKEELLKEKRRREIAEKNERRLRRLTNLILFLLIISIGAAVAAYLGTNAAQNARKETLQANEKLAMEKAEADSLARDLRIAADAIRSKTELADSLKRSKNMELSDALIRIGLGEKRAGNCDQAIEQFRIAGSLNPENKDLQGYIDDCLAQQTRYSRYEEQMRLGKLAFDAKEYRRAIDLFSAAEGTATIDRDQLNAAGETKKSRDAVANIVRGLIRNVDTYGKAKLRRSARGEVEKIEDYLDYLPRQDYPQIYSDLEVLKRNYDL